LTEKQFWNLTPKLFQVLCGRKYQNDRRELANAALITAAIANVNRGKGKRALSIEDIIGKDPQAEQKEPQPEELLILMQALHKKHGKKDNK
jgi:hypothetical protein